MKRWILWAGAAATLAAVPAAAVAPQADPGVAVRAFRFFRPDGNQTRVAAFVEVPYAVLTPTVDGPSGELKYSVAVQILDSAGNQLYQTAWPGRAGAQLAKVGATQLQILDFQLAPGRYRLEVVLQDSVAGRRFVSTVPIEGYRQAPAASDLVLSPEMRLASGSDTVPKPSEMSWGRTLVTAATELKLTPERSKAFYMLEAYAPQDQQGSMSVSVSDSTGRVLVKTRPTAVQVSSGGSVVKGQLDLAGLPAGLYTMTVSLDVAGHTEQRSDTFEMADLQETMAKDSARLASERVSDEGYFGLMNEGALDEAYAPLIYLARPDSLAVYKSGLSLQAKRQFLIEFWKARDPTPNTPKNEARELFYEKVKYATSQFPEGGRNATPGWRTDRGRIFVKYGSPSETLDRRAVGRAPSYQVWHYQQKRNTYYLFIDRTGFGAYQLMATNDLKETSRPGYRELLGPDALQDVSRFLGIDLFAGEDSRGAASVQ